MGTIRREGFDVRTLAQVTTWMTDDTYPWRCVIETFAHFPDRVECRVRAISRDVMNRPRFRGITTEAAR